MCINMTYTSTLQTAKAAGSLTSESKPSLHLFNVDVCVRCVAKSMYQSWYSNRLGAISIYDKVRRNILRGKKLRVFLLQDANRTNDWLDH